MHSVDVSELRKLLFDMVTAEGIEAGLAGYRLTLIDKLRDEHGRVESEPRHPNIDSGKAWPLAAQPQ